MSRLMSEIHQSQVFKQIRVYLPLYTSILLSISISLTLGTYGPATKKGATTTILAQFHLVEFVVILNNTYLLIAKPFFLYTYSLRSRPLFSKFLIALRIVLCDNDITLFFSYWVK